MQNQSQSPSHQSQNQDNEWKWPHAPATPDARKEGASSGGTTAPSPESLQKQVEAEAYRIAEERGFPQGADLEHWLEAERRINQSVEDGSASERH